MQNVNQTPVQLDDLKRAFNRARLYQMHITFEEALANRALSIALNRMAFAYANPKPARTHWQQHKD
jgi:hypothetical protein